MLPNKRKFNQKTILRFWPFLVYFCQKKQPKLTKNEENWQNPNRLIKFSEIWYVDTSQQKKMLKKTVFRPFWLAKKQPKLIKKNEGNRQIYNTTIEVVFFYLAKSKPIDVIFWNLVSRCFPTKENATKKLFFDFGIFGAFFGQKNSQNW